MIKAKLEQIQLENIQPYIFDYGYFNCSFEEIAYDNKNGKGAWKDHLKRQQIKTIIENIHYDE